MFIQTITVAT